VAQARKGEAPRFWIVAGPNGSGKSSAYENTEIEGFGGKINGTQKMDRKRFERMAGDLDSGFYVNVQFSLAPDKVEPLRVKLSLNEVVYRQFYLKQETVAA